MTLSYNHFDHQLSQPENVLKHNFTHPWLSKVKANSDQTLYTQSRFSSDRTLFSLTWDKDRKQTLFSAFRELLQPYYRDTISCIHKNYSHHSITPGITAKLFHACLTQWTVRDASSGIRYTHIGPRKDGIQVGDYMFTLCMVSDSQKQK